MPTCARRCCQTASPWGRPKTSSSALRVGGVLSLKLRCSRAGRTGAPRRASLRSDGEFPSSPRPSLRPFRSPVPPWSEGSRPAWRRETAADRFGFASSPASARSRNREWPSRTWGTGGGRKRCRKIHEILNVGGLGRMLAFAQVQPDIFFPADEPVDAAHAAVDLFEGEGVGVRLREGGIDHQLARRDQGHE